MATYWVKSGTGGTDAGTSWSNAAESIPGLMTAQAIAGGDIIYVHNTHNFAAGATIKWTLPESGAGVVYVLCVDGGDATGASLVRGGVVPRDFVMAGCRSPAVRRDADFA